MFGQGFNSGFFGDPPCFTDTTDIFKDKSGVALYTLDYDSSDTGGATGNFNEGVVLNGGESIDIPGSILGDFHNAGTHAISVSTWVYFAGPTSEAYAHLISAGYNQSGKAFWVGIGYSSSVGTSGVSNEIYMSGASATTNWTGTSMPLNQWSHIVYTWTGTSAKLYLNKTLIATTTMPNLDWRSSGNAFRLGRYYYNSNYYLKGTFDQTRIFNRAITQAEVNTLNGETNATTNTLQILGDSSCKAAYTFDGNLNDLSGNYNITTAYDYTFKYDGTPTNVDFGAGGKSLYGARFNGLNSSSRSKITTTGLPTYNNFSISFWMNSQDLVSDADILMGTSDSYVSNVGFGLYTGIPDNGINWVVCNGSSRHDITASGLQPNQWQHIVITQNISNNEKKIYVNGSLSATSTNSINVTGATYSLIIGGYSGYNNSAYTGSIDQVRIFNKALSSSEVSKLYGNGAGEIACKYTATTTDIAYPIANAAYYKLDNNSKDLSRTSGKFNEGAIFNGNSSRIELPSISQLPSNSNNTNNFTFSCWVKSTTERLNNGGGSNPIFQNNVGSYQFIGFGGNDNGNFPNGKIFYYTYGGSGYHNSWVITNNSYADGQWHHVVVTDEYNSGSNNRTRTIYVDGAQKDQDTVDKNFFNSSATNPTMGDSTGTGNRHADIDLDQVRIFNKAISPSEVTTLYNETKNTTSTLQILGDNSCVATYTLDGSSTDLSGNYSGTDTDVKYAYDGTETDIEYRFGKYGQAAVFNGTSSKISTPITSSDIGTSFTISCWVNVDAASDNYHVPIGNYTASGGWYMAMFNNMKFNFYNSVGGIDFSTTATYEYGNWYHFCVVFTHNSDLKVFINGNKETNSQSVAAGANSNGIQIGVIGTYSSSTNTEFDGKIDEVRIFSSALSDSQVTQLYNEKPETDTSNFKTVLYEGTGATQYISNVGMDLETNGGLLWIKNRDAAYNNVLYDHVRNSFLYSNLTNSQDTNTAISFEKNGFITSSTSSAQNANNNSYVAWNWKGGGDAVSNGNGTITSSVSANQDAGFSIVKYTGNGTDGATVGTGLTQACNIVIVKDLTSSNYWCVGGSTVGNGENLYLNDDGTKLTRDRVKSVQTNTFTLGNHFETNSTNNFIAYCWHSVAGYSKIGTYTGDGTTSGRIIYTTDDGTSSGSNGFEPSFLLTKPVGPSGGYWYLLDNKRSTTNPRNDALFPNDNLAEIESTNYNVDFLSNGFELKNNTIGYNTNNENYIYMAFK